MNIVIRNPFRSKTFGQQVGSIFRDRAAHATVELLFGVADMLVQHVGNKMLANSNKSNQKEVRDV